MTQNGQSTSETQAAESLRYLLCHTAATGQALRWHQEVVRALRASGLDVDGFCVTPDPPAPAYGFQQLDQLWRERAPAVTDLRSRLVERAQDYDVLVNYNGANVHPEWLPELGTFNVYVCWDDPESSHRLSRPVARYFDFAFTGNCACVPLYRKWGIERCAHLPIGFYPHDHDPDMSVERILAEDRELDVVFVGERESEWRRDRLDRLREAFPDALVRGRGWPEGRLPEGELIPAYLNAKVGWNLHNTVGPVNRRTFALPANGVLQVCDNKCRLGSLFELDGEVVGFDTVEECIELTRYYLAHEQERREVAARGFQRAMRDYRGEVIWRRMAERILPYVRKKSAGDLDTPVYEPEGGRTRTETAPRPMLKRLAKGAFRRLGLEVRRYRERAPRSPAPAEEPARPLVQPPAGDPEPPYRENPEAGAALWRDKMERVADGGWFEWPNMVAQNWAVASLVGEAKRIVELGGGTGCFAWEAAADPKRRILCSDIDEEAIRWARAHRARPNVRYVARYPRPEDGPFDLVVSVDVVEHVDDYRAFLSTCRELAPRAILTTPNRDRSERARTAAPPANPYHVREWSAGEFYWILKTFYRSVKLFTMADPYVPYLLPMRISDTATPVIADCREPRSGDESGSGEPPHESARDVR